MAAGLLGGDFSEGAPQISGNSFDGQLCFHGPRTAYPVVSYGMSQYMPVPGDFYVFPAWQPHSVMPFRGEGERWSLAFNAMAIPHRRCCSQSSGFKNPSALPLRWATSHCPANDRRRKGFEVSQAYLLLNSSEP